MLAELKQIESEARRGSVLVLQLTVDRLVLKKVKQKLVHLEPCGWGLETKIILDFADIFDYVDTEGRLEVLHTPELPQRLGGGRDPSFVVVREHGAKKSDKTLD